LYGSVVWFVTLSSFGLFFFFFFQAEDGIRDRTVTGVQTCALPICSFDEPSAKFPAPLAALEQFHDAVGQLFGIPFVHPDGAIPEMVRETGFFGAHDREFVGGGNGGRQTGKASGVRKNAQKRSLILACHFLDRQ